MPNSLRRFPLAHARRALAVPLAAVAWLFGSAVAQDGAESPLQVLPPASELFGSLPEPPTEAAPPAPVLDPANPAFAQLQRAHDAFATLPADARGRPDWARALREGAIQPRARLAGGGDMQLRDADVIMRNTALMPWVRFPHLAHTQWLACSNCHDALFVPKAGVNPITMPRILRGESCGVCHATVAFTALYTCDRCHSVDQPGP